MANGQKDKLEAGLDASPAGNETRILDSLLAAQDRLAVPEPQNKFADVLTGIARVAGAFNPFIGAGIGGIGETVRELDPEIAEARRQREATETLAPQVLDTFGKTLVSELQGQQSLQAIEKRGAVEEGLARTQGQLAKSLEKMRQSGQERLATLAGDIDKSVKLSTIEAQADRTEGLAKINASLEERITRLKAELGEASTLKLKEKDIESRQQEIKLAQELRSANELLLEGKRAEYAEALTRIRGDIQLELVREEAEAEKELIGAQAEAEERKAKALAGGLSSVLVNPESSEIEDFVFNLPDMSETERELAFERLVGQISAQSGIDILNAPEVGIALQESIRQRLLQVLSERASGTDQPFNLKDLPVPTAPLFRMFNVPGFESSKGLDEFLLQELLIKPPQKVQAKDK
jgi:hypothetical protein